jgi:peptide deformylase
MACGAATSAFTTALGGGGSARRASSRAPSRTAGPRPCHVRCAYGESRKDGTWVEKPQNTFGKLINVAKGQREIVQAGTPCLREIAEEIPPGDIGSAKIQELIQEMLTICRGRGVGLAAPQIGVPYRVFVMMDDEEGMSDVAPADLAARERAPFDQKVVINPVVTPAGTASALFFEGCLSVQGYRGLVRRWLAVRVRGLGGDGEPVDFVAKGWQARIAQHEMDHLDGVLYVDRMDTRTFPQGGQAERAHAARAPRVRRRAEGGRLATSDDYDYAGSRRDERKRRRLRRRRRRGIHREGQENGQEKAEPVTRRIRFRGIEVF